MRRYVLIAVLIFISSVSMSIDAKPISGYTNIDTAPAESELNAISSLFHLNKREPICQVQNEELAGRGCCSHHGGECGCSDSGRDICCDGTLSPSCGC